MQRVQVVVAHPDDESFGCGSLILHAKASGAQLGVVCATRGEAGDRSDGGDEPLAVVRERELRAAAALLGVDRLDLLDLADSGMDGEPAPGSLCAADEPDVHAAVRRAMEAFAPDVVVTLDASDGHRDHARIRDVTVAVARDLAVPRVYLSCLPRSLMRRWADEMRVLTPDSPYFDVDAAAFGTPDSDITTVVPAAEHLAARLRVHAVHASQTSPYEALSDALREEFLGTVYLRRVVPPATPGVLEHHFL